MAPSNRLATTTGGVATSKRSRALPPSKSGAKRSKAPPPSTAGAQSSILSFLIPKAGANGGDVAVKQVAHAVTVCDDDEIEVIGITDPRVSRGRVSKPVVTPVTSQLLSPPSGQASASAAASSSPNPPPWAVPNKESCSAPEPPEACTSAPAPAPTLAPTPAPAPAPSPAAAASAAPVRQASLLRFFTTATSVTAPPAKNPAPPSLQQQQEQQQRCQSSSAAVSACGTWASASGRTHCPPIKWVEGTDLTVDAFNYGAQLRCRGYFLSHFHSDHYCGLGRRFDGHLLASRQTAELVRLRLGVRPACIRPLDLQKWHDVPGARVLLLDANHCPGSALFLFLLPGGRRLLHTGDFRASPELLARVRGALGESPEIDSLYLDTTYCSPEYDFPAQGDVIESVLSLVTEFVRDCPRYLIACGSYALGKERIFVSIARHLGCRAGVDAGKLRLLTALGDPDISDWIARATGSSRLQVLPLRSVTHAGLRQFVAAWRGPPLDGVLGISPTGWSLGARGVDVGPGIKRLYGGGKGGGGPPISVYGVAYSEHSSYSELRQFVRGLRPRRVLPTVGWQKRDACRVMAAHFDSWLRATDDDADDAAV